jgi:multicomponent K+:H+ antiporter subunit D
VLVSVGLLIAAVTLQTVLAWSALLYYLISTTLCTGALFLLADTLESESSEPATPASSPETREPASLESLDDATAPAITPDADSEPDVVAVPAGKVEKTHAPWPSNAAGALYLAAAVGAAGLPPLSGFLGKAMVLAATPLSQAVVLWPAVLISGLLSIVALSRTGTRLLWAMPASRPYGAPAVAPRGSRIKLAACALLLAGVVAATVLAGPLKQYLDATAAQLLDREAYVQAILPTRATQAEGS